jgi:tetratricopeptide (TPR) repeat protein
VILLPISIVPEAPRALSLHDECRVQRAALDRDPASLKIRLRLASLLQQSDAFDEVIGLLTADEAPQSQFALLMLAAAYLSRKCPGDVDRALAVTTEAISLSDDDGARAEAYALHGKALRHAERDDAAKTFWTEALALDPDNRGAFKRLSTRHLREGNPQETLALCDSLHAKGINHTQLLAARFTALAALGRRAEAKALAGIDDFVHEQVLTPPDGWDDIESFNADLVAELLSNPAIREGRYGTASEHSLRIDNPATTDAPAMQALLRQIARAAKEHARTLQGSNHPWIAVRPERAIVRSWCVMTGEDGFEHWHMHPAGWMSGGYYPQVPASVVQGDDRAGCFALGVPDSLIGDAAAAAFGETLIRPVPGLLTLVPSHCYHRTYPHGAVGQRICIAFDICPL